MKQYSDNTVNRSVLYPTVTEHTLFTEHRYDDMPVTRQVHKDKKAQS